MTSGELVYQNSAISVFWGGFWSLGLYLIGIWGLRVGSGDSGAGPVLLIGRRVSP